MKLLALVLAMFCSLQLIAPPQVIAAVTSKVTITTDNSGGAQGQVPCNKIGNLLLADSIAMINGSTISIEDSAHQSHLHGKVFKVEQVGQSIKGFAHFTDGPDLDKLNTGECKEHVDLTDGTKVPGPISDVTSDAITVGGRSIPMNQVASVHSAKTFMFRTKTDASGKMSFEPTCTNAGGGPVSRHHHWVQRHPYYTAAIVVGVGCGIACAIAIPIACSHHHHHSFTPTQVSQSTPLQSSPLPNNLRNPYNNYSPYPFY